MGVVVAGAGAWPATRGIQFSLAISVCLTDGCSYVGGQVINQRRAALGWTEVSAEIGIWRETRVRRRALPDEDKAMLDIFVGCAKNASCALAGANVLLHAAVSRANRQRVVEV
jgi:hypothetical protein